MSVTLSLSLHKLLQRSKDNLFIFYYVIFLYTLELASAKNLNFFLPFCKVHFSLDLCAIFIFI
jgi:hypothetical protein